MCRFTFAASPGSRIKITFHLTNFGVTHDVDDWGPDADLVASPLCLASIAAIEKCPTCKISGSSHYFQTGLMTSASEFTREYRYVSFESFDLGRSTEHRVALLLHNENMASERGS